MSPIPLSQLEPRFYQYVLENDQPMMREVETLEQAHGLHFLCPACAPDATRSHSLVCWFEDRVPDTVYPLGRWAVDGAGLHDLSFVVGKRSNSIQIEEGCMWHGFITRGVVHD